MKFGITKREKLGLVAFVVGKPTANLEEGEARLTTWEDLGVVELAHEITEASSVGAPGPQAAPWLDNTKPVLVELQAASLRFLMKKLEGEIPGAFSDLLRNLQRRLLRLEAKTYELPKELRSKA